MEVKEVEVTCPCCENRLAVDVRSGRVLRWNRPVEIDETGKRVVRAEDWDQAARRVEGRMEGALDKFDESLRKEKQRETDLDELFRKAKEKLEDPGDDS